MHNDSFFHPFTKLLTVVVVMLAGFLTMFILGFLVAIPLFDMSYKELVSLFASGNLADNLHVIKYFQIIQTLGLFVIPPFIIARLFSEKPEKLLGFDQQPRISSLFIVVVLIFMALPFVNFLSQLNQAIHFPESLKSAEQWLMNREEDAKQITAMFLRADNLPQLLVNIFMIAIIPAIGEELMFRGIIQKLFTAWTRNIHWGILIAAILFSAMHVQFYGFIPRLALGILFGYLFFWSGSIWLPITGHFINNGSAVIYYYLVSKQTEVTSGYYETFEAPGYMVFLSVGMIALCCYLIFLYEK